MSEFDDFFISLRRGTKCPNCSGKKNAGKLVCRSCEKAEQEMERMLEKGITVEYTDDTKETLVGTKNPRKSTRYGKQR